MKDFHAVWRKDIENEVWMTKKFGMWKKSSLKNWNLSEIIKESQKQKHTMIGNFICSRAYTASIKLSMGFDLVSPDSQI